MKATQRKTIELARKKIPLRTLLHGKEIREAAAAVEQFRMKLNEQEFLYGAKITIDWENYGDVYAVARRPETDKEFEERIERARIAAEQKAERSRIRKIKEAEKARRDAEQRKEHVAARIKEMALSNGLSTEELIKVLQEK